MLIDQEGFQNGDITLIVRTTKTGDLYDMYLANGEAGFYITTEHMEQIHDLLGAYLHEEVYGKEVETENE